MKGYESSTILCMGTVVTQLVHGKRAKKAISLVNRALRQIEAHWSFHLRSSLLSKLNLAAGVRPVKVSSDLLSMLALGKELSVRTCGAFDITVGPLVKEWASCLDSGRIPADARIQELLPLVSANDIEIDRGRRTAFLPKLGQAVDLGGIAKGYAADRALEIYRDLDIPSAVINLGGNVFALGSKANGERWRVGIHDPVAQQGRPVIVLEVAGKSVVTSGGYERFAVVDGKAYHHLLDPRTGYPAYTDLLSATVVGDTSAVADGLATALAVLGSARAADALEEYSGFEAVLVTADKTVLVTPGLMGSAVPVSPEATVAPISKLR